MVTLGTDPEMFVLDQKTGSPIPVCGLIGGTKEKPLPLDGGYAIQEDNVMVEWNTPPMSHPSDFATTVGEGLNIVTDFVRTKIPQGVLSMASSQLFPHVLVRSRQAQHFGCSPDFTAHARGATCPAIDPALLNTAEGAWRFAGGHIHLGYDNHNDVPDFVVAAFADVFIGLGMVFAGEKQGERRALYGSPGRYRPTAYGIEYRTPSNFWLFDQHHREDIAWYAHRLGKMVEEAPVESILHAYKNTDWQAVQNAIMAEDTQDALRLQAYVLGELLGGKY